MHKFLQYYLPFYLIAYFLAAFVLPTIRTWKRTGIKPVTFGRAMTLHNITGLVMKLLVVSLFVVTLTFSFGGEWYNVFGRIAFIEDRNSFCVIGFLIAHASLVWICIAEFQMSDNWRIGIDEENDTELVTRGLFAYTRNPVFGGMLVTTLGLFLLMPNWVMFFITMLTFVTLRVQIGLEEAYLSRKHGGLYVAYKSNTRRLL